MKVEFNETVDIEITYKDESYVTMSRGVSGNGLEYGSSHIQLPLDTAMELCEKLTQIIHDAKKALNERMAE
jgi:hypothetical protein